MRGRTGPFLAADQWLEMQGEFSRPSIWTIRRRHHDCLPPTGELRQKKAELRHERDKRQNSDL